MNCCMPKKSKRTPSPPQQTSDHDQTVQHETLLRIPECRVDLMDEGDALELATGDFELLRITDEGVPLATTIRVGNELQWPLTKDEPVVKLGPRCYLFSLPMKKDEKPLSYGVAFSDKTNGASLGSLDSLLKENSLFTAATTAAATTTTVSGDRIDWKEFAPAVDDYNNVIAKAIAGGTGQIVKGIFKCSNGYVNQVHKGGENIQIRAAKERNSKESYSDKSSGANKNRGSLNKSLKRVRKLSKMTEKMSKGMLNVVGVASGSVVGPMVRSQAGKNLLSTLPGEVVLASLDAINKILDAAEAAEKQATTATSGAVTRMVTNRFGESAGEATGDALATAGHCAGTAWNVFKIRKAINPASSTHLNNAAKFKKP